MLSRESTPIPVDRPDLVPIALIALEIGGSVDRLVRRFGAEVVVDDVGMRAVPAETARRFFAERAEREARIAEANAQRPKASVPVPAGVPAVEGAQTGFESLVAQPGYTTPAEEFGRPRPNLLDEELAEGRRRTAEAKEKAAMERRMNKDLGVKATGTVRLVDRKRRVVELYGPELPGLRRPTERRLLFQRYGPGGPESVGHCFQGDGRRVRFLVDRGPAGDELLALPARYPDAQARPASPYGPKGWLVEG